MDRRSFLKKGVIGSAFLHLSSLIWNDFRAFADSSDSKFDEEKQLFFDPEESFILLKFIDSILGDVEKHHQWSKKEIVEKTFANFNIAASKLAPHAQNDLKLLFKILSIRPTRLALTGFWKNWPDMKRTDIDQILDSWSRSSLSIRRSAYDGLRDLTLASWYGDQSSWSTINFPGVPQL